MKKLLLLGIPALVVLIAVGLCARSSAAEVKRAGQPPTATPAPAATVRPTVDLDGLVRANWRGVPLPRPEWCTRGAWTMVQRPTASVPGCVYTSGAFTMLGLWPGKGCTQYQPRGASRKETGVIMKGNAPDMGFYTVCA